MLKVAKSIFDCGDQTTKARSLWLNKEIGKSVYLQTWKHRKNPNVV